jgi:excisionase family DNA binding protein
MRVGFWEFSSTNPEGLQLPDASDAPIAPEVRRISRLPAKEARVAWQAYHQKRLRSRHAEIICYPRRRWISLTLRSTDNNAPTEVPIVVMFGRQPGRVPNKSKRRETRAMLRRVKRSGNLQAEVLCVDADSRGSDIVEQLAAFLVRREIYDCSIQSLQPLSEMALPSDFIDPQDPRSYPAYKKKLQIALHATKYVGTAVETVNNWRNTAPGQPIKTRAEAEDFSISEVAKRTGLPRRTLYDHVNRGIIPANRRSGFVRISRATLDKLVAERASAEKRLTPKSWVEDSAQRHNFIKFLAEKRGIACASARKRISRLLEAKGRHNLLQLWREFESE